MCYSLLGLVFVSHLSSLITRGALVTGRVAYQLIDALRHPGVITPIVAPERFLIMKWSWKRWYACSYGTWAHGHGPLELRSSTPCGLTHSMQWVAAKIRPIRTYCHRGTWPSCLVTSVGCVLGFVIQAGRSHRRCVVPAFGKILIFPNLDEYLMLAMIPVARHTAWGVF
jgi:hypothetical protein